MPRRGDGSILVHVDPITAMGRRPFLASAWPWRAWTYLATACLPGALGLSVLAADLAVGGGLAKALIGLPLLAALALAGIPMGRVERWRLRLIDPAPIADPHRRPARPGVRCWLATRGREPATWRELGYAAVFVTLLWPLDLALAIAAVGGSAGPDHLAAAGRARRAPGALARGGDQHPAAGGRGRPGRAGPAGRRRATWSPRSRWPRAGSPGGC